MAKYLAIVAALFAALIAVASATTYMTVVTTTVSDEENPHGQSSCQTEIEQKSMSHCRMWMTEGRGRQDSLLRSAVANPRYHEEHLQECCDEMKLISGPCVCDGIKRMVMESQSKYSTQEMEQMMKKAESLPQMCDMESPTKCIMRVIFF